MTTYQVDNRKTFYTVPRFVFSGRHGSHVASGPRRRSTGNAERCSRRGLTDSRAGCRPSQPVQAPRWRPPRDPSSATLSAVNRQTSCDTSLRPVRPSDVINRGCINTRVSNPRRSSVAKPECALSDPRVSHGPKNPSSGKSESRISPVGLFAGVTVKIAVRTRIHIENVQYYFKNLPKSFFFFFHYFPRRAKFY